jgi:UDP-N-acetylmuramate-alanine ligase
VIADIFASRDTDLSVASAAGLADAIERASGIPALAGGSVDETARYVAEHLRSGDAVLVMGAGKSYRIARQLAAALEQGVIDRPRSMQ